MEEIWKAIIGYEGLYQVSNLGRIKSLPKRVSITRILNPKAIIKGKDWYPMISLRKTGKTKSFYIHRLVAMHFISNPENKPYVNHRNGIKSANNVDNLEWCTQKENVEHSFKAGLAPIGSTHPHARKVTQMDLNGNVIKVWDYVHQATRALGMSYSNLYSCCLKDNRTAGGFKWKFTDI